MFSLVLLVIWLLFILYQDLRYRAVYWICFPVLLVLLVMNRLPVQNTDDAFFHVGINSGFLAFQFALISLYFSVRERRLVNIANGYLGWGDVLLLACLACYCSPLNFLAFYLVSLLLILLSVPLMYWRFPGVLNRLPLAGFQAFIFCFFLVSSFLSERFSLTTDDWMLQLISGYK